ncbi:MAG: phosphotransferase [Gemmatales bacterium]
MWHHSNAQPGKGTAANPQIAQVAVPHDVLAAFGWLSPATDIQAATPGFSGALVWKITCQEQSFALKRWPVGQPVYFDLHAIHRLMLQARCAGLTVVPLVKQMIEGGSVLIHQGFQWDACSWQPGQPDHQPDDSRLEAAMTSLSRLHALWRTAHDRRHGVCTAVTLQYRRLSQWTSDEWDLLKKKCPSTGILREAVCLLKKHREHALARLAPWLTRHVLLQPCLGDVWADHVLYVDDDCTGLIDYGGVRYDHPAQDLARLIGSYTQGHATRRQFALSRYSTLSEEMEQLSIVLDETGVLIGLSNWLRWLVLEERLFPDLAARAMNRLEQLISRLSTSAS